MWATPPSTTLSVAATPAPTAGWYESDAAVTLQATDEGGSGVKTEYRLGPASWNEYAAPFAVSGEGVHSIYFGSTDGAGNNEAGGEHLFDLNIDYNPPQFVDLPVDGRFHYYYDWAKGAWAYTVSGKKTDTQASPKDLILSIKEMSDNISTYFINPDPLAVDGFSVEFLVKDPTEYSKAVLSLEDPAGHSALYTAMVPEPASLMFVITGFAGILCSGLRFFRKR